jgi:spore germination cell wall hydrolase CwlJ-like protein
MDLQTLPDHLILALTILGEARGEPVEGQIAVANVVRNRQRDRRPLRVRDVCLARRQFSCWNPSDPNRALLETLAAEYDPAAAVRPELRQALWIADGVIAGALEDNTKGATHYLTTQLLRQRPPVWAINQPVLVRIGRHAFLKVV